ncbi:uncharacterized protein LOC128735992 [Sabethes cyaneus]|uniref:uncharacterized protein LOC128735992 n=1 Tax=Sabethes cyaneus TaxID=53552 RepID=UPI00237DF705|nr:uncharacterized protein LOC128735992 [Sabethes cyaneus]
MPHTTASTIRKASPLHALETDREDEQQQLTINTRRTEINIDTNIIDTETNTAHNILSPFIDQQRVACSATIVRPSISPTSQLSRIRNPGKKESEITIYYQNMNSIKGTERQKDVYMSALALDYDVFAFTETYLDQSVVDEMLFPAHFLVYRCDRNLSNSDKQSGGGTLIAVNRRLSSSDHITAENNEALCVKIKLAAEALFLCCCYIPPTSRIQRYSSFVSFVDSIESHLQPEDDLIVIGDFNLPNLNWNQYQEDESNHFYLPEQISSQSEITIVDGLLAAGLMQICNLPNQNNTFLDLVFTTDTYICNLAITDPLIRHEIHHNAMLLFVKTLASREHASGVCRTRLKFELMNIEAVQLELASTDWNSIFISRQCFENNLELYQGQATSQLHFLRSIDVFNYDMDHQAIVRTWMDVNVISFYNKLYNIFVKHTPSSVCRQRTDKRYPEWFSASLIRLMKDKRRAFKYMRRAGTAESIAAYKQLLSLFKAAHREEHRAYIGKLQENLKTLPDPDVASEDDEILEIRRDTIKKYILGLDKNKSAGADNITNRVIADLVQEIVEPLDILFNSSLRTGYFPSLWKVSHLTPIYKKGNRSDVENYRGVAIQSAIPKLFEAIVYEGLYDKVCGQISSIQHGFLKGKSVVTNLCEFHTTVTDYISRGYQVDCIYTDMSKAFDAVGIRSVLDAAYDFGIRGSLLNWLNSYLTCRTQYVKIHGEVSQPFTVNPGVPQGSHLGPLLFVLVMNNLSTFIVEANILVYADDVKLFLPVKTTKECFALQQDLVNFGRFCAACGLSVA